MIDDDEILRTAPTPLRVAYLEQEIKLTSGDRDKEYGAPYDNLTDCAELWQAYLIGKFRGSTVDPLQMQLTAEDVAWLNVLQKIARTFHGNPKPDTYIDAATYAAIAGECAAEEASE